MSDKSWEPGMYECFNVLNNFCFHVYAQNLLSHFLTLTLTHSHSFSLSHSFNLSFNHSRHAEQVLFSCLCSKVTVLGKNCNEVFFDLITLSCYFAVHRAGSQLKIKYHCSYWQMQQIRTFLKICSTRNMILLTPMRLMDFSELAGSQNNNDQTFDFIKTISVLRSNPLNKLTIVLHKVESRFQYCPDWKQKFNSNKIRIFVINRKHVSTSKQKGYSRNFLI